MNDRVEHRRKPLHHDEFISTCLSSAFLSCKEDAQLACTKCGIACVFHFSHRCRACGDFRAVLSGSRFTFKTRWHLFVFTPPICCLPCRIAGALHRMCSAILRQLHYQFARQNLHEAMHTGHMGLARINIQEMRVGKDRG